MELIFPVDRLNSRPTVRIAHPVGADAKLQRAWVVLTTWGEIYIPIDMLVLPAFCVSRQV